MTSTHLPMLPSGQMVNRQHDCISVHMIFVTVLLQKSLKHVNDVPCMKYCQIMFIFHFFILVDLQLLPTIQLGWSHGLKSRSRPPTRGTETRRSRRRGSVSGDTHKMLHRKLKKSWKNHDKSWKIVEINIYVSHVQNISLSTLNIKRENIIHVSLVEIYQYMYNIVNYTKYIHKYNANVVIFTLNCDEVQNYHCHYPCNN